MDITRIFLNKIGDSQNPTKNLQDPYGFPMFFSQSKGFMRQRARCHPTGDVTGSFPLPERPEVRFSQKLPGESWMVFAFVLFISSKDANKK